MRESRDFEVAGRRFLVGQLPAMRALKLLNRLGRVVGPSLAAAVGAMKGSLAETDVSALGEAAKQLFDRLAPEETEGLLRELFATVEVFSEDGTKKGPVMPQFDLVFQGEMLGVFALARVALEVNYGDFFGVLLDRARELLPAAGGEKSSSGASTTSSGPSGA